MIGTSAERDQRGEFSFYYIISLQCYLGSVRQACITYIILKICSFKCYFMPTPSPLKQNKKQVS